MIAVYITLSYRRLWEGIAVLPKIRYNQKNCWSIDISLFSTKQIIYLEEFYYFCV